jgi:hypothetical protein
MLRVLQQAGALACALIPSFLATTWALAWPWGSKGAIAFSTVVRNGPVLPLRAHRFSSHVLSRILFKRRSAFTNANSAEPTGKSIWSTSLPIRYRFRGHEQTSKSLPSGRASRRRVWARVADRRAAEIRVPSPRCKIRSVADPHGAGCPSSSGAVYGGSPDTEARWLHW